MTRTNLIGVVAILAALLLIGCVSADQQITLQSAEITGVGTTQTVTMVLDSAPTGLSGYNITLTIADPAVAQFTAWQFPTWPDMTTPPATLPASEINMVAAAFTTSKVPDGSTNVLLGTATIEGLSTGTTTVTATINQLDDNHGGNYTPTTTVNPGTLGVFEVPVAQFSADKTTAGMGETVTFTDESTGNVASWAWTIQGVAGTDYQYVDGTSATSQNPHVQFLVENSYDVSLTVTNPAGTDTETKTGFIECKALSADFSVTATNGVAPMTVSFTDLSTGSPTTWLWEYRNYDESTWTEFGSGAQSPSGIVFNDAGTYDIRLTVGNGMDTDTTTKTHAFAAANAAEFLVTVGSGTVSGNLFVDTVSPWTTTSTKTFTLPSYTDIDWARLYVNTYSGSAAGTHGLTSTVEFNGNTLGVETMDIASRTNGASFPLNDHVTKVYSDYEAQYDVTSLITSTSQTVEVTSEAISGLTFDGRIKGITLVVAYNDGDGDVVNYIVNHGHDWIGPAGAANSTTFDATGIASGWDSATLKTIAHSGTDATYTLNDGPITKNPLLSSSYMKFNEFDLTSVLNAAATNTVKYTAVGSSFKTTIAALSVRYLEPPVADFEADKLVASTSDVIHFTDTSSGEVATWAWDFGDGNTSDQQNPTHTYATTGYQTVSLTVTNSGGTDTLTKANYINVVDAYISFDPASQEYMPSESRTYAIVLSQAPEGLAGYDVVVSLGTGSVADITAVTYPAWAQNTLSPVLPADSIRIGGVDSGMAVDAGASNVVLATITVRGTTTGSTSIVLSDLVMDADGGNAMSPTLQDGTANIGTYSGPVANFIGSPTSGLAPLDVTFTDQSSGDITTYQWDFNNDGTIDSTLQNPLPYTYAVGTYTVKLTVTGPGGSDSEVKTGYITAGVASPVASFTASPTSGYLPLTVAFNSTSSTGVITSYAWDFDGDGYADSLVQNPAKTYTAAGTYNVTLTVTGPGGSDSKTETGLITVNYPAPVAQFLANPTSGTAPLTVAFSDQSTGNITSRSWTFGDGETSTDQNPVHTYESAGTYTVALSVTGAGGSDVETKTDYITVTGLTANFDANHYTGVASRNVSFDVSFIDLSSAVPTGSMDTWSWNFGNGETSTVQNPTVHYFGRPQSFTVSLDITKGVDSASVTKTNFITITPRLEAFPTYSNLPTDLNGDGLYEDINGNGRADYDDVVAFFHNMNWIETNYDVDLDNYDYNNNGRIDYNDLVILNDIILYG